MSILYSNMWFMRRLPITLRADLVEQRLANPVAFLALGAEAVVVIVEEIFHDELQLHRVADRLRTLVVGISLVVAIQQRRVLRHVDSRRGAFVVGHGVLTQSLQEQRYSGDRQ